jgi:putative transcriptional regulator
LNFSNLTGQFLIAMPTMPDVRFAHAVIYICTHNETGAMGLIVNRHYGAIDTRALFEQLDIKVDENVPDMPVHYGGPVESSRGFILHTTDYTQDTSMRVADDVAMTATMDILKAVAEGNGPVQRMLFLGYSGWGAGQLEQEIQDGGWLLVPHDTELLFDRNIDSKWERAIQKLGFSPGLLSTETGHA